MVGPDLRHREKKFKDGRHVGLDFYDLLIEATKGILRKVNKLVLTALRLAATRKVSTVDEAILLDATSEALL